MNKKQTIQIVVVVLAFGLSGIVLYRGFFSGSSSSSPTAGPLTGALSPSSPTAGPLTGALSGSSGTSTLDSAQSILPYGSSLDFSQAIQQQKFQYGILTYPTITPADIGLSLQSLFSQPVSGQ